MLWCRSQDLQQKGQEEKGSSYGHAYSIVNNFKGYDHVHIFWFCSRNKKNVSLSNKVIRDFGSGNVKQTESSEKYFSLLISEPDFKELKKFLTESFKYNAEFIGEPLPVHYDRNSGKSGVRDFIPAGASEWKLFEEEGYNLSIDVTGYYDLRYSPSADVESDDDVLAKASPVIDKIDLSALKTKS